MTKVKKTNAPVSGAAGTATIYINLGLLPGATPAREALIRISGNQIDGVSKHGIDVRNIAGHASIVGNPRVSVPVGSQPAGVTGDRFVNGIRCLGLGRFLVADNHVVCDYRNGAGIRLQGGKDPGNNPIPIKRAVVINNTITMSQKAAAPTDDQNAGVELRRACENNLVVENVIGGTAHASLSLAPEAGQPQDINTLVLRTLPAFTTASGFTATSGYDVVIPAGVTNTLIIGEPRSIDNKGTDPVPIPR